MYSWATYVDPGVQEFNDGRVEGISTAQKKMVARGNNMTLYGNITFKTANTYKITIKLLHIR